MLSLIKKLNGIAIAVLLLSLIPTAHAANALTEQSLTTFLKNSDALSDQEFMDMNSKLESDYTFEKIQTCLDEKMKPYADKPHDNALARKLIRFTAECRLKFFKANEAFQKSADVKAHKEVEAILSTSADDITPEAAKEAVKKTMALLPMRKLDSTRRDILASLYEVFNDKRDYKTTRLFEGRDGISSIDVALEKVDPIAVYRVVKKTILLTDTVWTKKPQIVEF